MRRNQRTKKPKIQKSKNYKNQKSKEPENEETKLPEPEIITTEEPEVSFPENIPDPAEPEIRIESLYDPAEAVGDITYESNVVGEDYREPSPIPDPRPPFPIPIVVYSRPPLPIPLAYSNPTNRRNYAQTLNQNPQRKRNWDWDSDYSPSDEYEEKVKDDPLEDLLLKEPDLFNQYATEIKDSNLRKLRDTLFTDRKYLHRFLKVWPKTTHKQRRHRCMKFLEQNPGMRTMNPEVLWQRIFYYHVEYEPKERRRSQRK